MRQARVLVNGVYSGILKETQNNQYVFEYDAHYVGAPVSLTMPVAYKRFDFEGFPPFFEGLLPEAGMLEALLRRYKLDKNDYFGQLLQVGQDLVGHVQIEEMV